MLIIVGATGFNLAELRPLDTGLIFMSMHVLVHQRQNFNGLGTA